MNNDEPRLIRAAYSARTITIYQAYSPEIAGQAVRAGTFVPPFSHDRMTWIKPSFGWKAEQKTSSPVRIQWDPDRSLQGAQLPRRAIQVGLSGAAVHHYVQDWICSITDITRLVRQVQSLVGAGRVVEAENELPAEHVYPITAALATRIGAATGVVR
jgi:hypothetical protein